MEKTRNKVATLLSFLICLLFAKSIFGSTPINIELEEIYFANSHILETKTKTNDEDRSEYFALTVDDGDTGVRLKLKSNFTGEALLYISATSTSNIFGNICTVYSNPSIVANQSFYVDLEFDGSIPMTVQLETFTCNWKITAIPCGTSNYCAYSGTIQTSHRIYVLYDDPVGVFNGYSNICAEVLDYSCAWAQGQNDDVESLKSITRGLYNNTNFSYDIYNYGSQYVLNGNFKLLDFINDIDGIGKIANCYDMARALTTFSNALGISSVMVKSEPFGYVNCIKPIGQGWTNNPFYASGSCSTEEIVGEDYDSSDGRSQFSTHTFCSYNSKIYDACLKVDTDQNPDTNSNGTYETWVYDWGWSTYSNYVIDDDPISYPGTPSSYSFGIYY